MGIDFKFFGNWLFLNVGTLILRCETIFFLIFSDFFDFDVNETARSISSQI